MSVRRGACVLAALAVAGCATGPRFSPRCEREADRDPRVQALQMEILGNIEGNGLRQANLDALRGQAAARCQRRQGGGAAGGVAAPAPQPGRF